jgi:hypothetical protein
MRFTDRTIPRGILLFWALWLSLVSLTNVLDALKSLRVLGPGWAFASGNFAFMASVTAKYHTPTGVNAFLFAGVVAWEIFAACRFWHALSAHRRSGIDAEDAVRSAFTVSLALWAAFMLADETFFAFDAESTHIRIFIAQLVSLVVVRWLSRSEAVQELSSPGGR